MTPERWHQIKQIYHPALDLEPGPREAFLKEACASGEALLKEVSSLLAQAGNSVPVYNRLSFTWLPDKSETIGQKGGWLP